MHAITVQSLCSLHPDEFLEAWAHSNLSRWSAEWLGFRSDFPQHPDSPKRICVRCPYHRIERPRALCVRLGEPVDSRHLTQLVSAFVHGIAPRQADAILASLMVQLADLIDNLTEGALFQFATATLWLLFDTRSCVASGGPPRSLKGGQPHGRVKLSHFAEGSMQRSETCDHHCLSALHAVQCAVSRSLSTRLRATSMHSNTVSVGAHDVP